MFRGPSKVTLDAKGRLAIPSRHRERIVSRADGQLVATIDRDHCLLIYPLPDWEEVERKLLSRLSAFKPKSRRVLRLMLGYASELEMDGHGRILLPQALREFAGLERNAMLIGQGNKFELWDEQRWKENCEEWLTPDDSDQDLPDELDSMTL